MHALTEVMLASIYASKEKVRLSRVDGQSVYASGARERRRSAADAYSMGISLMSLPRV